MMNYRKCLTVNTSKHLKYPTRMLYRVKPATLIFQRFVENALANIPYTVIKQYGSFRKLRKSIYSIKKNR